MYVSVADDNKIVSGSADFAVRIWDLERLATLEKVLSAGAYSPDINAAIWVLIQKYSQEKKDLHSFCNELNNLIR